MAGASASNSTASRIPRTVRKCSGASNDANAAHGNSLRGLFKHLEQISDEAIPGVEIPTGKPLVYELDGELQVVERYYLEEKIG
jgi:hypothetical protein